MIKSGWKTTEFWVTVSFDGALVVTQLTSTNLLPPKYATLAAGIANGLYAISRGIAKYGPLVQHLLPVGAPGAAQAVPVVPVAVVAPEPQPVDPGQGKVI